MIVYGLQTLTAIYQQIFVISNVTGIGTRVINRIPIVINWLIMSETNK